MSTRCQNCQSLLILTPSGAACSRDPNCGGVIGWFDRKGIEAAWKEERLNKLIAALPEAACVDGKLSRWEIEGEEGEFVLETVIAPAFLDSRDYAIAKLQAHGMTLAFYQAKSKKIEFAWFTRENREPEVEVWDVPARALGKAAFLPPPVRDPNLPKQSISRVSKQALKVLEMLRSGPKTNRELLDVAIRYGSRIHDLRKAGYDIKIVADDSQTGLTTYQLMGEPSHG